MKRKLVYICSPLRSNKKAGLSYNKNVDNALKYTKFAYKKGCIPIVPHLYFTIFLYDGNIKQRKDGMEMGLQMLNMCDEIWVFGDYVSEGMRREIAEAIFPDNCNALVRRFFDKNCKERLDISNAFINGGINK